MGQGAAVGVAEDDGLGAAIDRAFQGFQGIVLVILEAVEKMFGIVEEVVDGGPEKGQGVLDEPEVVVQFDMQGVAYMNIPAFAEDGHRRGLGTEQRQEIGVFFRAVAEMAG